MTVGELKAILEPLGDDVEILLNEENGLVCWFSELDKEDVGPEAVRLYQAGGSWFYPGNRHEDRYPHYPAEDRYVFVIGRVQRGSA